MHLATIGSDGKEDGVCDGASDGVNDGKRVDKGDGTEEGDVM